MTMLELFTPNDYTYNSILLPSRIHTTMDIRELGARQVLSQTKVFLNQLGRLLFWPFVLRFLDARCHNINTGFSDSITI